MLIDKVKFENSPDLMTFLVDSNLTLTIPAPEPAAFKLSRDNSQKAPLPGPAGGPLQHKKHTAFQACVKRGVRLKLQSPPPHSNRLYICSLYLVVFTPAALLVKGYVIPAIQSDMPARYLPCARFAAITQLGRRIRADHEAKKTSEELVRKR